MKPITYSQADGSGDEPGPPAFKDMSEQNDDVQRSLGRIEGKLDTALSTLTQQGQAILSLQLWRARSMGYVAGVSFVMGLLGAVAFKAFGN